VNRLHATFTVVTLGLLLALGALATAQTVDTLPSWNDGTLWAEQPMYFQVLFALYVHHTDSEREWAYDRESSFGRLDKGLDQHSQKAGRLST
jgi:hypothetical protein